MLGELGGKMSLKKYNEQLPSLYKTALVHLGAGIMILHYTQNTLSSNQLSCVAGPWFESWYQKTFSLFKSKFLYDNVLYI